MSVNRDTRVEKLCSLGAKNKPVSLVELSLSCQSQRLRSQVTFDYVTSQFIIEDSSSLVRSLVFALECLCRIAVVVEDRIIFLDSALVRRFRTIGISRVCLFFGLT